ncbi:MAG: hypothetical protein AAF602_11535 [Myxococcota bacterium]
MFALAMTLIAAPFAHAGPAESPVRNAAQRLDNQRDRRDAALIADLTSAWNRAIAAGNRAAALETDARIFAWLEQEIVESQRDAAEARREMAQSSRELRGSRRQDRRQGGAVNQLQRGDDRRDRRDDMVDSEQAQKDLEQTRAIDAN